MKLKVFQKGFNYSQDGPGNRLIYHLQGCNMRCPWCSNPEGMPIKAPIMQLAKEIPDFVCDKGAVKNGVLDRSVCEKCAERGCVHERPNSYVTEKCKEYELSDIVKEAQKCVPMFIDGGGVTFTGGEVFVQLEAMKQLLPMLKEKGIHIAIESNATIPGMKEVIEYLDFVMCDYKHYDAAKLAEITGADLSRIDENFKCIIRSHKPFLIRIPVVNGFNASKEDVEGFIEKFKSFKECGENAEFSVELLSYHEYGKEKWGQCGLEYKMTDDAKVSPEFISYFTSRLKENGFKVVRT